MIRHIECGEALTSTGKLEATAVAARHDSNRVTVRVLPKTQLHQRQVVKPWRLPKTQLHQRHVVKPWRRARPGELTVRSIALALAPKQIRKQGETRRSFGFEGQRVLYRELNLLHKAKAVVSRIINQDQGFLQSPFRQIRWHAATQALHKTHRAE